MSNFRTDHHAFSDTFSFRKQEKKAFVSKQQRKLLEVFISATFVFSLSGNLLLYKHTQQLEQATNRQILQYDSLLSAKLIVDRELMKTRMQVKAQQQPLGPVKALPAETANQAHNKSGN